MEESVNRVVIDDDGDIDLVVGVDAEQRRLRVSSKVLSLASKVFRVMFSEGFKEGNDLRMNASTTPVEIPLPDDDAAAMTYMCLTWHFKSGRLPASLLARELRAIAVIADKYDCVASIMYSGDSWIQQALRETLMSLAAFHAIAEAALLLESAFGFKLATQQMLLYGTEDTLRQLGRTSIIPEAAFERLVLHRSTLMKDMMEEVLRPPIWSNFPHEYPTKIHGTSGRNCQYVPGQHDWSVTSSYQSSLREHGLGGAEWVDCSLNALFTMVNDLSQSEFDFTPGDKSVNCLACMVDIRANVRSIKSSYERRVSGLCMTFAKRGEGKVL